LSATPKSDTAFGVDRAGRSVPRGRAVISPAGRAMLEVFFVVAPIFLLMGLGYLAVRFRLYPAEGTKALIGFVNNFATPCLLFQSMLNADFSTAFNPAIIGPFYAGALSVLAIGTLISAKMFRARPGVAVASGFSACFANSILIGFPLVQRAYGDAALPNVFSIISLHAPVLITVATLTIELARRDGRPLHEALGGVALRMVQNPLLWGVALGLIGNLLNLTLVEPVEASVRIMAGAVMPVALFGLGGALNEYRLADSWPQALVMTGLRLVVHPAIAWVLMVPVLGVDPEIARYGVLLAAMPAGINVYVFSTIYNRGVDVAANTVLLTTVLSIFTISGWLLFLGH